MKTRINIAHHSQIHSSIHAAPRPDPDSIRELVLIPKPRLCLTQSIRPPPPPAHPPFPSLLSVWQSVWVRMTGRVFREPLRGTGFTPPSLSPVESRAGAEGERGKGNRKPLRAGNSAPVQTCPRFLRSHISLQPPPPKQLIAFHTFAVCWGPGTFPAGTGA